MAAEYRIIETHPCVFRIQCRGFRGWFFLGGVARYDTSLQAARATLAIIKHRGAFQPRIYPDAA